VCLCAFSLPPAAFASSVCHQRDKCPFSSISRISLLLLSFFLSLSLFSTRADQAFVVSAFLEGFRGLGV
jgi:hypothetical protein